VTGQRIPRITTARLLLREWQPQDRAPFARLNADPRVAEHLGNLLDRAESDALLDQFVARWAVDGYGVWAVERLDDGAFLGFTGLSPVLFNAPFAPATEIEWRLVPEAWGRGYATESARAALQFGFESRGLEDVVSFTVPANVRSRAVMERLGMTRDPSDDFDHPGLPPGHKLRRHVLYRLSREGWATTAKPATVP
jgi:RimJ/RimL family protein N-acetyltransferase